jgi:hypothetical protein
VTGADVTQDETPYNVTRDDENGERAQSANEAAGGEGGCACRYVRYRMTSKPLFVRCCHCRWCQRETGTALVPSSGPRKAWKDAQRWRRNSRPGLERHSEFDEVR